MEITNLKRVKKIKNCKIPNKFLNVEFIGFLNNCFPLADTTGKRDLISITGFGSILEYAEFFTLFDSHRITVDEILKLLEVSGCILEIDKRKNSVRYQPQQIVYLRIKIEEIIKK